MSLPVPIITVPSGCCATRVALERVLALTPATVKTFGAVLRTFSYTKDAVKSLANTGGSPVSSTISPCNVLDTVLDVPN